MIPLFCLDSATHAGVNGSFGGSDSELAFLIAVLPPEEYRVTDLILIDVKNMLVDATEGRGEMFVELPARWGRDSPVCSR